MQSLLASPRSKVLLARADDIVERYDNIQATLSDLLKREQLWRDKNSLPHGEQVETIPEPTPQAPADSTMNLRIDLEDRPARRGRIDRVLNEIDEINNVQFLSTRAYFLEGEGDGTLGLDVICFGKRKGACSVKYETMDRAAKAGVNYVATSGVLTFAEGDSSKSITVQMLDNDIYCPVSSFKVILSDPIGCDLDAGKSTCRITIKDNDTFPSNALKGFIKRGWLNKIGHHKWLKGLYANYFRMDDVGFKIKMILLGDHVLPLNDLLQNWLKAYMVNTVLNPEPDQHLLTGERFSTLYLLAVLAIVPQMFFFFWDRFKASLGLGHKIQAALQGAVVRTYFNISDVARSELQATHVNEIMQSDTQSIAHGTLDATYALNTALGNMVSSIVYIAWKSPEALWMVVLLVFTFACLMWYETPKPPKRGSHPLHVKLSNSEQLTARIDVCSRHCRIINDFDQVARVTDDFNGLVTKSTHDAIRGSVGGIAKHYMPQVLSVLFMALWVTLGGRAVLSGKSTIGQYVVTTGIIKKMGGIVTAAHNNGLAVLKSVGALSELTLFLNLEVQTPHQEQLLRKNKAEHYSFLELARRQQERASADSSCKNIPAEDLMRIELMNVSLAYGKNKVMSNITFGLEQGSITVVVGNHGSGKRSLMRLLGGLLHPDEGHVFLPAHLQMVHLDRFPELMHEQSLMDNLTYGHDNIPYDRARAILSDLIGNDESSLLNLLDKEVKDGHTPGWWRSLTQTDLVIMHIGRAFVLNPEVLVWERVIDLFNVARRMEILKLLRQHVDQRGLHQGSGPVGDRRPRTVIYCSMQTFAYAPGRSGMPVPDEIDNVCVMRNDGGVTICGPCE